MRILKALLCTSAILASLTVVPVANAQVIVSIGVPPVCSWGYYDYAPYGCAPKGFYGPGYFYNGIFLGMGPWAGWGYDHGWGGHRFSRGGGGSYRGGGGAAASRGFSGRTSHNSPERGGASHALPPRGSNTSHAQAAHTQQSHAPAAPAQAAHSSGGGQSHGGGSSEHPRQ